MNDHWTEWPMNLYLRLTQYRVSEVSAGISKHSRTLGWFWHYLEPRMTYLLRLLASSIRDISFYCLLFGLRLCCLSGTQATALVYLLCLAALTTPLISGPGATVSQVPLQERGSASEVP